LSRTPAICFRDQVANRVLQPLSGSVAAHVDLDHLRQACEKQCVCVTLATEVAADKRGRSTSAAEAHRAQITAKELTQLRGAVDQLRR
jgi:hypothetical protein